MNDKINMQDFTWGLDKHNSTDTNKIIFVHYWYHWGSSPTKSILQCGVGVLLSRKKMILAQIATIWAFNITYSINICLQHWEKSPDN